MVWGQAALPAGPVAREQVETVSLAVWTGRLGCTLVRHSRAGPKRLEVMTLVIALDPGLQHG